MIMINIMIMINYTKCFFKKTISCSFDDAIYKLYLYRKSGVLGPWAKYKTSKIAHVLNRKKGLFMT